MHGKWNVVLVAILLSALVLGCATPAEKTVKAGDLVYVDYTLKDTGGKVIETTNATVAKANNMYDPANPYTPYSFIAGSGMTISGFDKAVTGMKVNETKNITLSPAEAYGDYNQSLVVTTPPLTNTNVSNYTDYVGKQIIFNGENAKLISIDPANNTMTLDYNSPMAGKTLVFNITVLAINPSPTPNK